MTDCICAEPLRVGKSGKARIKPCPLHGFFGEKVSPDSWPCATCESGEHNTSQHGTGFSAEQHEWAQLIPSSPDPGREADQ